MGHLNTLGCQFPSKKSVSIDIPSHGESPPSRSIVLKECAELGVVV